MSKWLRHCADYPVFQRITPEDTVVDIGCGAGDACVAAGMMGAEVIAIDIDPDLVPHLERRMHDVPARAFRAIASDCNPIPLPDEVASFVICTEVMEHVEDPAHFAAELNRIGRPGATYLVSVPDPVSESLMRLVAHPSYFERPNHQRIFSRDSFDELLRAAGLDVIERPRAPNNFYWAMWCLLRWADSPDGNPSPGAIPAVMEHWNRIWTTLQSSPNGTDAIELLDRLIPRTQVVISRKSSSPVDLSDLKARWRNLVQANEDLSNPSRSPRDDDECTNLITPIVSRLRSPASRPTEPLPMPAGSRSKWRRYLKDGEVRLGRIDVSWSVRRGAPGSYRSNSKKAE